MILKEHQRKNKIIRRYIRMPRFIIIHTYNKCKKTMEIKCKCLKFRDNQIFPWHNNFNSNMPNNNKEYRVKIKISLFSIQIWTWDRTNKYLYNKISKSISISKLSLTNNKQLNSLLHLHNRDPNRFNNNNNRLIINNSNDLHIF